MSQPWADTYKPAVTAGRAQGCLFPEKLNFGDFLSLRRLPGVLKAVLFEKSHFGIFQAFWDPPFPPFFRSAIPPFQPKSRGPTGAPSHRTQA